MHIKHPTAFYRTSLYKLTGKMFLNHLIGPKRLPLQTDQRNACETPDWSVKT